MTGGFKLAEWTVEPQLNSLERNGRASRLEPKVMQVLGDRPRIIFSSGEFT